MDDCSRNPVAARKVILGLRLVRTDSLSVLRSATEVYHGV